MTTEILKNLNIGPLNKIIKTNIHPKHKTI